MKSCTFWEYQDSDNMAHRTQFRLSTWYVSATRTVPPVAWLEAPFASQSLHLSEFRQSMLCKHLQVTRSIRPSFWHTLSLTKRIEVTWVHEIETSIHKSARGSINLWLFVVFEWIVGHGEIPYTSREKKSRKMIKLSHTILVAAVIISFLAIRSPGSFGISAQIFERSYVFNLFVLTQTLL